MAASVHGVIRQNLLNMKSDTVDSKSHVRNGQALAVINSCVG